MFNYILATICRLSVCKFAIDEFGYKYVTAIRPIYIYIAKIYIFALFRFVNLHLYIYV